MIPFILFYELLELWKSVVDLINNNFLGFRKYSSKPEVSDHVSLFYNESSFISWMLAILSQFDMWNTVEVVNRFNVHPAPLTLDCLNFVCLLS